MIGISPAPLGIASLVVGVVFIFFDFITVILRIWATRIKNKGFNTSDYLIFAATFFATVDMITKVFEMRWGSGAHYMDVVREKPEVLMLLQQITYAQYFIWGLTILLIKLSILLLYRTLFQCMRGTLLAIHASIALCIAIYFLQVGILFGSCKPLAYNWDQTIAGSCYFDGISEYVISMSLNLAMDIIIVILPAAEVWRLQHVTRRKKAGITCLFGLGILTCILVGLRFKYLLDMNLMDTTHDGVPSGILSSVELYIGIIGACLPLLPPAFVKIEFQVQKSYIGGLLSRKTSNNSLERDGVGATAEDVKEPDYDHMHLNPWPSSEENGQVR